MFVVAKDAVAHWGRTDNDTPVPATWKRFYLREVWDIDSIICEWTTDIVDATAFTRERAEDECRYYVGRYPLEVRR